MFDHPFEDFPAQVKPWEIGVAVFELCHNAQRMLVVIETTMLLHQAGQGGLTGMTKRGMTNIMGQADCFHQIFVRAKGAGNRSPDLSDFDGVGKASAVIIAFVVDEDLGLILKPAKSRGVDNAFAVALETRAKIRLFLRIFATLGVLAAYSVRRKELVFNFFKLLSAINHAMPLRVLYVVSIRVVIIS